MQLQQELSQGLFTHLPFEPTPRTWNPCLAAISHVLYPSHANPPTEKKPKAGQHAPEGLTCPAVFSLSALFMNRSTDPTNCQTSMTVKSDLL